MYRWISHFSSFFHGKDVFRLKQIFLHAAISEYLNQIHLTPTDLELHACLANTYILLSKIFIKPKSCSISRAFEKQKEEFEDNFQTVSRLAIEEFQILNQYAPHDPWVHEQLASGYHDLKMSQEEINEVEILLQLRPQDKELLMRLGVLYFAQGMNAKGLKIYEELKLANYKKAENLIASYGTYKGSFHSFEIL